MGLEPSQLAVRLHKAPEIVYGHATPPEEYEISIWLFLLFSILFVHLEKERRYYKDRKVKRNHYEKRTNLVKEKTHGLYRRVNEEYEE